MVTKPQDGGNGKREKLVAPVLHTAQLMFSSRSQLQNSFMQLSSHFHYSASLSITFLLVYPQHFVYLREFPSVY